MNRNNYDENDGEYNDKIDVKIAFLGKHFVGKTAIITRIASDTFIEGGNGATVGALVVDKIHQEDGYPLIKFAIWDTAGQERFRALIQSYYRDAHVVVVVFDITKKDSFDDAKDLVTEVKKTREEGSVLILLIGNKIDMEEFREVSKDEAGEYATSNGLLYMETSALSGEGIFGIISTIYRQVIDLHEKLRIDIVNGNKDNGETSEGFAYEAVKKKKCC